MVPGYKSISFLSVECELDTHMATLPLVLDRLFVRYCYNARFLALSDRPLFSVKITQLLEQVVLHEPKKVFMSTAVRQFTAG